MTRTLHRSIALRGLAKGRVPRRQLGSFLLEALIAILIVAFGILGLIGLEARAIQNVDDAQYRAEAAFIANALLGQMWAYDQTKLKTDFDSASAGPGTPYAEFKAWVGQRLPGASIPANVPVVTVTQPGAITATSSDVLIQVFWLPPGETVRHKYEVVATVGTN
jgi:type IV pilus assembly protein PilV